MKKIIFIIIVLTIILTCFYCKPKAGFGKDKKISGIVYLKDSISSNNTAVQNATVYIGFESEPSATNYNYKTVTNNLGEFSFEHLFDRTNGSSDKINYHLHTVYEQPGTKRLFEDTLTTAASHENIEIILAEKDAKSIIEGTVLLSDSLSNTLKTLSNADVFLGYSFLPTSSHYTYKVQSDANGRFVSPALTTGTANSYSLYIQKTINIGGNPVLFKTTLNNQQLDALNKQVELLPANNIGYLRLQVVSGNLTPQVGFTTCVFSNKAAFSNTLLCNGSFYSQATNLSGYIYLSGLNPGSKYYLKSYKIYGNDTILAKDSLIYSNILYPAHTTTLN
jgi:hypothetical protein